MKESGSFEAPRLDAARKFYSSTPKPAVQRLRRNSRCRQEPIRGLTGDKMGRRADGGPRADGEDAVAKVCS